MPSTALRVTVRDLYFRSLPTLSQSFGPVAHFRSAAVLLSRLLFHSSELIPQASRLRPFHPPFPMR